ncbi:hypothetical protein CJF32_00002798 [Rutstroemia sp. NJR-2017a WRK4]|nr:hypothetical protein CJF32_00002798 [Rutstroemia sp. NJR-2017a WRK4]
MSQYTYSLPLLGSDSIRLLSLMPSKVATAPIQCQLHNYDFGEYDEGTHLYEALSYVWGSCDDPPQSVYIDGQLLHVTTNLYAALLHLRDRNFARIIWVDYICINQNDKEEKSRQINLMARVYGEANRVIVYLGEAADNSDQAIECIRSAADEEPVDLDLDQSINEKDQEAVLEQLKRPWFQRMWVAQEAALARRILVMCGFAKINGYTFCSGISNLQLSYEDHSVLQGLVRPLIYLMRGAIFRPTYAMSSSEALSLGELVDMYHARKATERHDKIYALLSMTSDDPNPAGLLPDYTVPWKTLFQRLIKFILSKEVSVETWDHREIAVIESKGCVLGHVTSVKADSARSDRQHVKVIFYDTADPLQYSDGQCIKWTLKASAQHIQKDDLVCLLQGTSKPVIIRACKDHFSLVMIAVTPRNWVQTNSEDSNSDLEEEDDESPKPLRALSSIKNFSRDFLLVWDWGNTLEILQGQAGDESSMEINALVPGYLMTDAKKADMLIKTALALGDTKFYDKAKLKIQEAVGNYEQILGEEDLSMLALKESLAWIYSAKNQKQRTEAANLMLQVIRMREVVQGTDHQDTRKSVAKLASIYMGQDWKDYRKTLRITSRVTNRIEKNIQIDEDDIVYVASVYGGNMMALLLSLHGNNILVTENVLRAAATNNAPNGEEVMKLLLEKQTPDTISEEIIKNAATNHTNGRNIMKVLLKERVDIRITKDIVKTVAREYGELGREMMELFLEERDADIVITEEIMKAVAYKPYPGIEIMKLLLEKREADVVVTEAVVKMIAGRLSGGVMKLLLEKRGEEVAITEKIVRAAAGNKKMAEEVMKILLRERGAEVVITEEVLKAAAGNKREGERLMWLLLNEREAEVVITEEVVKAAAGNRQRAKEVMMILIEERGAEVVITEEVLKVAAGNWREGVELLWYLLEKRGAEVVCTEDILKAAVGHPFGDEAIEFFQYQRKEDFEITEGVKRAAATSGQDRVLEFMSSNLKISVCDEDWSTARLVHAILCESADAVGERLAKGVNPDFEDTQLVSPLWIAAKKGRWEVVKLLLGTGLVQVNSKNIAGQPPLFWPAAKGYVDIVELLLQAGADYKIADKDGNTPLSIAEENGHYEIVEMMTGQWPIEVKNTSGGENKTSSV